MAIESTGRLRAWRPFPEAIAVVVSGLALLAASLLLIVVEVFVPSGGVISLVAAVVAVAGVVCLFRVSVLWGFAGLLSMAILAPLLARLERDDVVQIVTEDTQGFLPPELLRQVKPGRFLRDVGVRFVGHSEDGNGIPLRGHVLHGLK